MSFERWVYWCNGLMLVTELDGAAFLRAKDHGEQTRWEEPVTLKSLERTYGKESRLYGDAYDLVVIHAQ